jgi:dipeptidase D
VVAVHAGLECGVLMSKMEGLDAVSVGPDMADVHTPNEHISISSTERTWEYLLEVLKQIKSL